jgi:hypothetical protein
MYGPRRVRVPFGLLRVLGRTAALLDQRGLYKLVKSAHSQVGERERDEAAVELTWWPVRAAATCGAQRRARRHRGRHRQRPSPRRTCGGRQRTAGRDSTSVVIAHTEAAELVDGAIRTHVYEAEGDCLLVYVQRQDATGAKLETPIDVPAFVSVAGRHYRPTGTAYHLGTAAHGHFVAVVPRVPGTMHAPASGWMLVDNGQMMVWPRGLADAPRGAQLVAVLLQRVLQATAPVPAPASPATFMSAISVYVPAHAPTPMPAPGSTPAPTPASEPAPMRPSTPTTNAAAASDADLAAAVAQLAAGLAGGPAAFPSILPGRETEQARGNMRVDLLATTTGTSAYVHRSVLQDWLDRLLPHDQQLGGC